MKFWNRTKSWFRFRAHSLAHLFGTTDWYNYVDEAFYHPDSLGGYVRPTPVRACTNLLCGRIEYMNEEGRWVVKRKQFVALKEALK